MLEALVTNYVAAAPAAAPRQPQEQLLLFERSVRYGDAVACAAARPDGYT